MPTSETGTEKKVPALQTVILALTEIKKKTTQYLFQFLDLSRTKQSLLIL